MRPGKASSGEGKKLLIKILVFCFNFNIFFISFMHERPEKRIVCVCVGVGSYA